MKKIVNLFALAIVLPLYFNNAAATQKKDVSVQNLYVDQSERCSSCGKPKATKDTSADSISTNTAEKCGCGKPRTNRDTTAESISERCSVCGKLKATKDNLADALEKCGCGKPRTNRDTTAQTINQSTQQQSSYQKCSACQVAKSSAEAVAQSLADATSKRVQELDCDEADMIEACCSVCEQPDSLGCQGENSARCRVCQRGRIKQSIKDRAALALAASKSVEGMRFPRETFPNCPGDDNGENENGSNEPTLSQVNSNICALGNCCAAVFQRLVCHSNESKKCCKKIKNTLDDLEDLVEDQIGDTEDSVALPLPTCEQLESIIDVVNGTDIDVLSWLKSIYVLLAQIYVCSCEPCLTPQ